MDVPVKPQMADLVSNPHCPIWEQLMKEPGPRAPSKKGISFFLQTIWIEIENIEFASNDVDVSSGYWSQPSGYYVTAR